MDPKRLKNPVEIAVLALLSQQILHGWDIIKILSRSANAFLKAPAGTMYPMLDRLQRDGLVTKHTKKGEKGRPIYVYRITPKGQKDLRRRNECLQGAAKQIRLYLAGSQKTK